MAERYTIVRTQPTMFLDEAGIPVEGYQIQVTLHEWNEGHLLKVRSLDQDIVEKAIEQLIEQRAALDELGG